MSDRPTPSRLTRGRALKFELSILSGPNGILSRTTRHVYRDQDSNQTDTDMGMRFWRTQKIAVEIYEL